MISKAKITGIALGVGLIGISTAVAQPAAKGEAPTAAKPETKPEALPAAKPEPQPDTQEDTTAEQPQEQEQEQPQEHVKQQEQAYIEIIKQAVYETDMGNWKEARALFRRAHDLQPNARTYRGMGMVAFNMRDYVQAIRDLTAALADERRKLTESQTAHAEDLLTRARQFVGQYRLELDPAGAVVEVDGNRVAYESDGSILVNLGEHSLRVTAEGHRELTRTLKVGGGENRVLKLALQPEIAKGDTAEEPRHRPGAGPEGGTGPEPADEEPGAMLWTWVALGGAVAFGAAGITFGLIGDDKYKDLEEECGELGCLRGDADTSPVETNHTLANVFYGVSGACLIGAVVLFFVEADEDTDEEDSARQKGGGLSVGPGMVGIEGTF